MAEEHIYKAPEGHRLCVNNCTKSTIEAALSATSSSSSSIEPLSVSSTPLDLSDVSPDLTVTIPSVVVAVGSEAVKYAKPNRCSACRKKVGLTGFRCRCGTTFCGTHRYPEKHGCGFDFKAMGREEIARANPVVKADKLERI